MPRVFISYSWDSDEHKDRVRALATHLRKNGIDARLDQWEGGTPRDGWPAWCSRQVLKADVIVVVCTQRYHDRFHALTNRNPGGVIWESQTIQNLAYFHYLRAGFLPIVLDESDRQHVPACVLGAVVPPLVWPTADDWDSTDVLARLDPGRDSAPRHALPIPEPKTPPTANVADGPSVVDYSVWEGIAQIQNRLEILAEQFQQPYRPILTRPLKNRSDSSDPSLRDLRYAERWLDYQATPQLGLLQRWIDDPGPFSWWAVIAPGGAGKSRLALELIDRLDEQTWDATFLTDTHWLEDRCRGWRPRRPTLLVIDYAIAKQREVIEGLQTLTATLTADKGFPKVRVLLLDRSAGFAPGFATPQPGLPDWNTIRKHVRKTLYRPGSGAAVTSTRTAAANPPLVAHDELIELGNPLREEWAQILRATMAKAMGPASVPPQLPAVSDSAGWRNAARLEAEYRPGAIAAAAAPRDATANPPLVEREELVELQNPPRDEWPQILRAIMAKLKGPAGAPPQLPSVSESKWWNNVARLTDGGRMLYLEILALILGRNPQLIARLATASGRESLLDAMIYQERTTRWPKAWPITQGGPARAEHDPGFTAVVHAIGFATLVRGISISSWDDWEPVTEATSLPAECHNVLRAVLRVETYPLSAGTNQFAGNMDVVKPLEPDLLGEWFLLGLSSATGAGFDARPAEITPRTWIGPAMRCNPIGTAQTLSLIADDFPDHPQAPIWVGSAAQQLAADHAEGMNQILATATAFVLADAAAKLAVRSRLDGNTIANLAAFANRSEQIGTALLVGFASLAVQACGSQSSQWDDLTYRLAWESGVGISAAARAAVDVVGGYGAGGKLPELERWGAALVAVADSRPYDRDIQCELANAAFNAITSYGSAQKFAELECWGETLTATADRFPEDREIQVLLAKGENSAIRVYGSAQRFDELERWGEALTATADRFPADREIQQESAKAAFNAINGYGSAAMLHDLERWGKALTATALRFPDDWEIQMHSAEAAVNAINHYGSAARLHDLERWGEALTDIALRFPEDPEIQLRSAMGAFNAINDNLMAQNFDSVKRWGEALTATADRFPEARKIQATAAKAAVNAIGHYGSAQRFDELERWGESLATIVARCPEDQEIQLASAKAAVNAIGHYGSAKRFDDLERWGEALTAIAVRFPGDREVQLELAKAAFNAINGYGSAQKFDELERWKAIADRAIRRSRMTTDVMNSVGGIAAGLFDTAPPAATVLFDILTEYWPGFPVPIPEAQQPPLCLLPLLPEERLAGHRRRFAEAQELLARLGSGAVTTIAEAAPLLRQLWALRMYLRDRGDSLVPALSECHLEDLVAEAARDPWRDS